MQINAFQWSFCCTAAAPCSKSNILAGIYARRDELSANGRRQIMAQYVLRLPYQMAIKQMQLQLQLHENELELRTTASSWPEPGLIQAALLPRLMRDVSTHGSCSSSQAFLLVYATIQAVRADNAKLRQLFEQCITQS